MTASGGGPFGWGASGALTAGQFQDLFEHAPCGYHSLDANGRYLEINRTELGWLGRKREDVVGKLHFSDVLTPSSRAHFDSAFEAFKREGKIDGVQHQIVGKDGWVTAVTLTAVALYNKRAHYVASRALLFNITPLVRAQQEQRGLNARLRAALNEQRLLNQELEAFSYSVSHDLRAPLRTLDGFSKALLEDCHDALDDKGRDYLGRIRAGAQRMAGLIDDLLALARVTRSDVNRQPVDVTRMAREIVSEIAADDPDRHVIVSVQTDLTVNGDPQLVRIALQNLLENAWKFTRGTVHPRIDVLRDHSAMVPAFAVRDNGAGFDMRYADKLFGVFQRLHSATEFPGTGVGLATVQRVVHKHGGRIWAEGHVGAGAAFSFTLEPDTAEGD